VSRAFPRRCAAVIGATVLALAPGCGSRYERSRCASSPFPEARAVLAQPGFEALRFFLGAPTDARREFESEIWSDAKFNFRASLQYEYPKSGVVDCPCAVRMVLQYPLSAQRSQLGGEFLSVFERQLGTDLTVMRSRLQQAEPPTEGAAPVVASVGPIVAEAVSIRSPNRGDVLALSFIERSAYERRSLRSAPGVAGAAARASGPTTDAR
jgi:hypothetical protein